MRKSASSPSQESTIWLEKRLEVPKTQTPKFFSSTACDAASGPAIFWVRPIRLSDKALSMLRAGVSATMDHPTAKASAL